MTQAGRHPDHVSNLGYLICSGCGCSCRTWRETGQKTTRWRKSQLQILIHISRAIKMESKRSRRTNSNYITSLLCPQYGMYVFTYAGSYLFGHAVVVRKYRCHVPICHHNIPAYLSTGSWILISLSHVSFALSNQWSLVDEEAVNKDCCSTHGRVVGKLN